MSDYRRITSIRVHLHYFHYAYSSEHLYGPEVFQLVGDKYISTTRELSIINECSSKGDSWLQAGMMSTEMSSADVYLDFKALGFISMHPSCH